MSLPKLVHSRQSTVHSKKSVNRELLTVNRKSRGFSLIELLVVITIIAILLGAATVSYTKSQQKGRDAKRKSDLKAVQQALELYYQTNGKYPSSTIPSFNIKCDTPGDSTELQWGNSFTCSGITYMQQLPKDPSGGGYGYYRSATTIYSLSAKLENTNDPDLSANPPSCIFTPNRNYCTMNP